MKLRDIKASEWKIREWEDGIFKSGVLTADGQPTGESVVDLVTEVDGVPFRICLLVPDSTLDMEFDMVVAKREHRILDDWMRQKIDVGERDRLLAESGGPLAQDILR